MSETLLYQTYRGYFIDLSEMASMTGPPHYAFAVSAPGMSAAIHTGFRGSLEYAERAAKEWIDARVISDKYQESAAHNVGHWSGRKFAEREREYDEHVASYRESAKPPERYGFMKCPQYTPEKPHKCSPPGFFARLMLPVSEGDMWRCECGRCYIWLLLDDAFFSKWASADQTLWRQACAAASEESKDAGLR